MFTCVTNQNCRRTLRLALVLVSTSEGLPCAGSPALRRHGLRPEPYCLPVLVTHLCDVTLRSIERSGASQEPRIVPSKPRGASFSPRSACFSQIWPAQRRTPSTSLRVCGRIALRLAMLHSEAHNSMRTPMESTRRRRRHCHPAVVRPPRTHHRLANRDSRGRVRGTARLRPTAPQRNAPGKECRTALQCAAATAQTLHTREHPSEHHPWMKSCSCAE